MAPRVHFLHYYLCNLWSHSLMFHRCWTWKVWVRRSPRGKSRDTGVPAFTLDLSTVFIPCGEFRWSPEGPVSQIHSPYLNAEVPGIFSDLLRSVQMLKSEWGVESNVLWAELQPWCLNLQWKNCHWAEHSDDDVVDNNDDDVIIIVVSIISFTIKIMPWNLRIS